MTLRVYRNKAYNKKYIKVLHTEQTFKCKYTSEKKKMGGVLLINTFESFCVFNSQFQLLLQFMITSIWWKVNSIKATNTDNNSKVNECV